MPKGEIQEQSRGDVVRKPYAKLSLEALGKVEDVTEGSPFTGSGTDIGIYS